jgi:endonuclease YncB( thermonuclease family)
VPTKRSLLSWLSALACLALAVPALSASPRSLVATVKHVSDADIVTAISANGTRLRIRLLGLDAPEIPHDKKPGQPFGEEAGDWFDFPMRSGVRSWSSGDLALRKGHETTSRSSVGSINARLTPLHNQRVRSDLPCDKGRET